MFFARLAALAALALVPSHGAVGIRAATDPAYTSAGLVNAATGLAAFAPNTIVSLYGTNLSYNTAGIAPGAKVMPRTLGGVTVYVNGEYANLFYVSALQINFLIPTDLRAGPARVTVVREGTAGPEVTIALTETAPGFFHLDATTVIATHVNGSLVTSDAPASPGETVIFYAVGLGRTTPDLISGQIATGVSVIQHLADLQLLFNGASLDPSLVLYAGLAPGFAGLYQLNVQLPSALSQNSEVRVAIGDQASPQGLRLPSR